jgi:tetratricopeptide (TPR) repeat protein
MVLLLGLAMTASAFAQAHQEANSWIGKRVMVISPNASFQAQAREAIPAPLGTDLQVTMVNGPWLWFKNGRGWLNEKDVAPYEQAIDVLTARLTANPTSEAFRHRGVVYVTRGEFEQASMDFSEAIRRGSDNVTAFNDRGNAYRKLGKLDLAAADFDELIRRNVRHPALYTNRGLVRHDQGQFDRALQDFSAAVNLDAKFAPAWEAAGATREAMGDFSRAIQNYRRAIDADPNFDRAHNNLAWILATHPDEKLRDGNAAVQHATKACQLTESQDPDYLDTLAAALAEMGQFDEAVMRAAEAVEKSPAEQKPEIENRRQLYESKKPFRTDRPSQSPLPG